MFMQGLEKQPPLFVAFITIGRLYWHAYTEIQCSFFNVSTISCLLTKINSYG